MSGFSKNQFEVIMDKLNELLAKNDELEKAIAIKDDELALQKEQIAFLTQKLYGRKKESLDFDPNQVNLFDDQLFIEPEHTGDQSDEVVIIKAYGRKKRKGLKQAQLNHLPTVDHIHEIEACSCPNCQEVMKEISTTLLRQEVKYIPARMENHRHFQKTYACSNCEKTGINTPFMKSDVLNYH